MSEGDRSSLYRAYRSRTFDEVVGQRHVTQTLRNAVRYGKVAHAYLFTGPRGTGKTSTARILARAVNCLQPRDGEPCNVCTVCVSMLQRRSLDLVEIDGASNNSVDDVRELRERVNLRPVEGKRKVFIIDEVHMLSIGAFNALLKTLEEPPDHILFALATTELHKVPATVRSRCQLLELHPISATDMVDRVRYVCGREGIEAGDDVLRFITSQSTGSLRDALSLLEQIRAFCGDTLVLSDVEAALGVARNTQVVSLAGAMADGDLANALLIAGNLMDGGVDPRQLTRQLSGYWRDALVGRSRQKPVDVPSVARCRADQIVPVLYTLMSVETGARRSDSPRWALETAIAEATLGLGGETSTARREPAQAGQEEPHKSAYGAHAEAPREAPRPAPMIEPEARPEARVPDSSVEILDREERPAGSPPTNAAPRETAVPQVQGAAEPRRVSPDGTKIDPRARWPMVLRRLQENNKPQVHQLLQKVVVEFIEADGQVLMLPFRPGDSESFIRSRLETTGNRKILEDAVSDVLGGQWSVRCVTIDEPVARRGDLVDLEYLEQMAAEAKALGGEREYDI
jgi:DNA polymerase-3 subunit gamma/tau